MTGRQLALLPDDQDDGQDDEVVLRREYGPANVPVTPIATSGRTEYTAHCPRCHRVHRHTGPGIRRGPCGATYTVPAD